MSSIARKMDCRGELESGAMTSYAPYFDVFQRSYNSPTAFRFLFGLVLLAVIRLCVCLCEFVCLFVSFFFFFFTVVSRLL